MLTLARYSLVSTAENKAVARKFVQEIFNEGKIDKAENFVTSDISLSWIRGN